MHRTKLLREVAVMREQGLCLVGGAATLDHSGRAMQEQLKQQSRKQLVALLQEEQDGALRRLPGEVTDVGIEEDPGGVLDIERKVYDLYDFV